MANDPEPLNLDGMERDIHKMKKGFKLLKTTMKPHWKRFINALTGDFKDIGHSYINLFVESNRADPYTTGHIQGIAVLLNAAAFIALLIL